MTNNIADIRVTIEARQHIEKFLNSQGKLAGFRFGVKKSGCSGYAYIADIAAEPRPEEVCIEANGIRIFLDKSSIAILKGTIIDLMDKGFGQKQLFFNNPNVQDSCGCGESFTVTNSDE